MSIARVYAGAVVSGASTCSFDLGGATFSRVYVEVGTMSTAAAFDVYTSSDGSNWRPLFERTNTAPVQYQTLTVASGVGANGGIAPLGGQAPLTGQYVQFRASAVVSGGVTMSLIAFPD